MRVVAEKRTELRVVPAAYLRWKGNSFPGTAPFGLVALALLGCGAVATPPTADRVGRGAGRRESGAAAAAGGSPGFAGAPGFGGSGNPVAVHLHGRRVGEPRHPDRRDRDLVDDAGRLTRAEIRFGLDIDRPDDGGASRPGRSPTTGRCCSG